MIKNIDLFNSVKKTIKVVFNYYRDNIVLDQSYIDDSTYLFITFSKADGIIKNFPEFKETIRLLKSDSAISELEGKLVGTHSDLSDIGSLDNCLKSFLFQLYTKSDDYSDHIIESEYLKFEGFFLDSNLRKLDSTRLYNYKCAENKISLGNGLNIQKAISPSSGDRFELPDYGYSSFSKSNFIITREYETKKIVDSAFEKSAEEEENSRNLHEMTRKEEMPHSPELFDRVITSLRILKSSGVYRDHEIESLQVFSPTGETKISKPFFENTVIGSKCELLVSEADSLMTIYNFISSNNDSRFGVSVRRLSDGMERKNIQDQLIDYMIGLETMYLPDGTAELSFRLSLRVAFTLKSDSSERKQTFEFLRSIYNIRSKIVHGKSYKLDEEKVLKVENLLRDSIKLWITKKDNFLDKITENGNQKDGKLNTIFFD